MNELIIVEREDLVAVADAVRNKTGITEELTIGGMIDGINSISHGIDTSDATATAGDILSGKTAYVDGEKVIGVHECEEGLDTSDATATAEDVLSGKTAYVNGEKITGSHECSGGASLDTCTINCTNSMNSNPSLMVTVVNNGVVETTSLLLSTTIESSIQNVLCGSCAVIEAPAFLDFAGYVALVDGEEQVASSDYHIPFVVPNKKDGTVEVVIE